MKRLFYILLFFFAALFLLLCPSCKQNDPHPLRADRYPIDCDVTVYTEKGNFSAHLFLDRQNARLTLKGDEKTEGITFLLDEQGNAALSYKDLTLPVSTERLPEKGLLFSLLRLPEDTPLLKSTVKEGTTRWLVYTLVQSDRNVLFYLDGQGTLKKITIEQDRPLTVVFEY